MQQGLCITRITEPTFPGDNIGADGTCRENLSSPANCTRVTTSHAKDKAGTRVKEGTREPCCKRQQMCNKGSASQGARNLLLQATSSLDKFHRRRWNLSRELVVRADRSLILSAQSAVRCEWRPGQAERGAAAPTQGQKNSRWNLSRELVEGTCRSPIIVHA